MNINTLTIPEKSKSLIKNENIKYYSTSERIMLKTQSITLTIIFLFATLGLLHLWCVLVFKNYKINAFTQNLTQKAFSVFLDFKGEDEFRQLGNLIQLGVCTLCVFVFGKKAVDFLIEIFNPTKQYWFVTDTHLIVTSRDLVKKHPWKDFWGKSKIDFENKSQGSLTLYYNEYKNPRDSKIVCKELFLFDSKNILELDGICREYILKHT